MDGGGEFVNVSRVLDSGKNGFQGNLGFGDDEIMVEIVGSDVFVDGVGGNEICRNAGGFRELGNVGGGEFLGEGVGVEDYGVIEDVVFLGDAEGLGRREAVMGCENEERLGGREEARGSGETGCQLITPSANDECGGVGGEALSCDSEVSGGNCVGAPGLCSGETEVIGDKMDYCFSENSDGLELQIGFSNASKTEEISEEVSVEVKERGVNGKDQVVHNIVLDAELPCLETVRSIPVETDTGTTCVNTESADKTEAVAGVNEMLSNQEEILHSGSEIGEIDVCDGDLQCSVGEGHVKNNNLVTESFGEPVSVSDNSMSYQKADDDDKVCNKGIETRKSVKFSEGSGDYGDGTEAVSDLVSTIKHTKVVAGYNEVICNKIATINDIEMTTKDSFSSNPMSEVSDIKAVQCKPKHTDAGKDCKEVLISETEVSEMNLEEATKCKESEADASGVGLSVCGGDNSSFEATLKRTEVLDLKEDPAAGVDCISGCLKEVRNIECDPVAEKGDSPATEENIKRQGLVSETGLVQYIKAVVGFENVVAQEQLAMVIPSDGIVEADVEKISDGKMDSSSKTVVLDGPDEDHDYDEEQVDAHADQEMEIQGKTTNIVQSEVIDEKTAEKVSSRPASSISKFHSRYLLPPNNDGEFSVGDLVWSKDRRLPWWPGQIYNPADAPEKAMKHHKKDCFLVAYFGARTFVWNDTSWIKPFRTHFSQIERERNSEAYHQAVNCALVEISRRVQLGLSCLCIPKNSFFEVESQMVENIGTLQEAGRRFHVDESTAASCFEPGELLEHIKLLALLPSASCDDQLQLTISKAQVEAFSRFKRHHPQPEVHLKIGLLEDDANTSSLGDVFQEDSEQVKGQNRASSKRRRDLVDSLPPRKRSRSMSELIGDMSESDGEEECDDIRNSSVTSSAARKGKALESVTDGSSRRQVYYAAKVSTTASQIPKKSFKIGECILRVASQLTGSPLPVKGDGDKNLETDDGVDQCHGFDYSLQTSVNSQQGMMLSLKHLSIDEMLSQLHLTAQNPMKNYSFLNEITSFFSGFRQSVMDQKSRRWNQPIGRGSEKNKAPDQSNLNPLEDFEFDDTNDSYWTDRIVQNYDEEQILDKAQNGEAENQLVPNEAGKEQIPDRGQNGEVENQLVPNEADKEQILDRGRSEEFENQLVFNEAVIEQMLDTAQYGEAKSQLVPSEANKPAKSGRRSRKRSSSGKQVMAAEKPIVEHMDVRSDCTPTELILKFTEGKSVPSELNLNKIFRRFGPIREPETEIDRESGCAKVVYKRYSDAKVALSSAGTFNIFGPMLVSYEVSNLPSAPFKTLPAATLQDREDAS